MKHEQAWNIENNKLFRIVLGPSLYKRYKWNFPHSIIARFGFWLTLIWLISIIDDVTAAIFVGNTRALSRPQFWSDFHEIWHVSTCTHDTVWDCNSAFCVINFRSNWRLKKPLKPEVTWIRKQNAVSDWFWPAEHEYMHI